MKEEAEKELAEFYPKDPDGATPIAYLWARTITCENPVCGAEVPLIGNFWLCRKKSPSFALSLDTNKEDKIIDLTIRKNPNPDSVNKGLTKNNKATCPICEYVTPTNSVKSQLFKKDGGNNDAKLYSIVISKGHGQGSTYRIANKQDELVAYKAKEKLSNYLNYYLPERDICLIPDELSPPKGALGYRFQPYGIRYWRDLYNPRQLLTLTTFTKIIGSNKIKEKIIQENGEEKATIIQILLSLAIGRLNDRCCTLCRWEPDYLKIQAANGGENKMPMRLDYVESNPFGGRSGDWGGNVEWIAKVIEHISTSVITHPGVSELSAAQKQILPSESVDAFVTDPPYYGAYGYSDLSEFFYIWLRRSIPLELNNLFKKQKPPKNEEAIVIEKELSDGRGLKDHENYLHSMKSSFENGRITLKYNGVSVIVFASKDTAAWEAILEALISSGWIITGSWPIDTEMAHRTRAIGSAALNSSIHIVCRPRENPDGSLRTEDVGDWGTVLKELPPRIHEWMERLSSENVVGADAIFACLGPALEIYSRYSRVEKVSGEEVTLGEYLEHVWATVSREALSTIFRDADTEGFESDARLTAMWLWTLSTGNGNGNGNGEEAAKSTAFGLEYDTARKIAQGLGAHLDQMPGLVEIKGSNARLLPV
ncbi:MAG: DUF1156 domain-containing protein, partial [Methanocalculus sp.]|nr:DUF1156 domain-containing protein [Methanocalculus sp.]